MWIIDHGRVIAEGTSSELKASVGSGTLHVRLSDRERRGEAARLLSTTLGAPVELDADAVALSARVPDAERVPHGLAELTRSGIAVTEFALGQPSLDEVFLALTGRPAGDQDRDADGSDGEEEAA